MYDEEREEEARASNRTARDLWQPDGMSTPPEDPPEPFRRAAVAVINNDPVLPEGVDTETLCRDYEVLGFMAPFVVVRRKSDGAKGSFTFRHKPRIYFGWKEDAP
jgi:hypothetical protein